MTTQPVLFPVLLEADTTPLMRAVAAYLARFKDATRVHTESDLRAFLVWCSERRLAPLDAQRVHVELYVRWMQEVRRFKPSTVSRRMSVVAGFYLDHGTGVAVKITDYEDAHQHMVPQRWSRRRRDFERQRREHGQRACISWFHQSRTVRHRVSRDFDYCSHSGGRDRPSANEKTDADFLNSVTGMAIRTSWVRGALHAGCRLGHR